MTDTRALAERVEGLDRLTAALVEDILETPDEEILAEMREDGIDPEQNAAEMRARFAATLHAIKEKTDDR